MSKQVTPALDVLRTHYRKLDAARNTVQSLETLIEEKHTEAAQALESIPSLEDLYHKREDLLAEIAAGEDRAKELKALEETIARQEASARELRAAAEKRAADAQHTIAGLQRKLELARAELEALAAQTQELCQAALLAEAERECAGYVSHARELQEHYLRLVALERILRYPFKSSRSILGQGWGQLRLPAFNLPQCDGLVNPNWPGILFSAEIAGYGDTFERATERERARLESLGVRFD